MKKVLNKLLIAIILSILTIVLCACNNEIIYDWQLTYLNVPQLWNKSTGKNSVIAVIDSGINYDLFNDDFKETRVIASYNAYDCNDDLTDYTQHGTAMVYLIGANGENGFYGIAPDCKFIIIKALNAIGSTSSESLNRAIKFAVDNGADIINLSLGSNVFNQAIADSIDNAVKNNIFVVCAVGDQNKNKILFPASYSSTISVGAIDCNGEIYKESNFDNTIDIFMPGVNIQVPSLNASSELIITEKSGSSIATAILSGYLANYVNFNNEYDVLEVYNQIRQKEFNIKNLF